MNNNPEFKYVSTITAKKCNNVYLKMPTDMTCQSCLPL